MTTREEVMTARAEYIKKQVPRVEKIVDQFVTENFEELKTHGSVEIDASYNASNKEYTPEEWIHYLYTGPAIDRDMVIRTFGRLGLYIEDNNSYYTICFKP